MRIYLLRHGESESNVGGFINDDPARPVRLTARGRQQAREAGLVLGRMAFDQVYASEFPRARQTAEIVLLAMGSSLPVRVDGRLNERRSGLDGEPVEAFNGLVRPDPVHIRPERGESFLDEMERVRGFLDETAIRHREARVLAVSHENPILAATSLAGRPVEEAARGGLGNCQWVALDWPPAD